MSPTNGPTYVGRIWPPSAILYDGVHSTRSAYNSFTMMTHRRQFPLGWAYIVPMGTVQYCIVFGRGSWDGFQNPPISPIARAIWVIHQSSKNRKLVRKRYELSRISTTSLSQYMMSDSILYTKGTRILLSLTFPKSSP